MKLFFLILAVISGGLSFWFWQTIPPDPTIAKGFLTLSSICLVLAIFPVGKAKYIACCSTSVTEALLQVGVQAEMLVCPLEGTLNNKFLLAHLKDYKYVIYDANPSSNGEMAVNDIQQAVKSQAAGASVLVRFDQHTYSNEGLLDRARAVEMLLTSNRLRMVSTTQLQVIVTKYYGKKG